MPENAPWSHKRDRPKKSTSLAANHAVWGALLRKKVACLSAVVPTLAETDIRMTFSRDHFECNAIYRQLAQSEASAAIQASVSSTRVEGCASRRILGVKMRTDTPFCCPSITFQTCLIRLPEG